MAKIHLIRATDHRTSNPMNSLQRVPQLPSDFAEVLQARLRSDAQAEAPAAMERGTVELLRAHIATLEMDLAKAEENWQTSRARTRTCDQPSCRSARDNITHTT